MSFPELFLYLIGMGSVPSSRAIILSDVFPALPWSFQASPLIAARTGHGISRRTDNASPSPRPTATRCSAAAAAKGRSLSTSSTAGPLGGGTGALLAPRGSSAPNTIWETPRGAVHFDAWLKKTRFYQAICPNWSRDQEGPEAEANVEAEAEASLADAQLDSLRDAAWLQESPEEEGEEEREEEGEEEEAEG